MSLPYQKYQRMSVSTADPLRIVVLLYEGAIKNLNQAIALFTTEAETASARITRTLEIINYLRTALDHANGGEVAFNLERLYDYMRNVLAEANIHKDEDRLREVIALLQTLLEGWRGILPSPNQTAAEETPLRVAPSLSTAAAKSVSMFVG